MQVSLPFFSTNELYNKKKAQSYLYTHTTCHAPLSVEYTRVLFLIFVEHIRVNFFSLRFLKHAHDKVVSGEGHSNCNRSFDRIHGYRLCKSSRALLV